MESEQLTICQHFVKGFELFREKKYDESKKYIDLVFAELRDTPPNVKAFMQSSSDIFAKYGYCCWSELVSYIRSSNNFTKADVILQNSAGYKQCKRKASDCDGALKKRGNF